MISLDHFRVFYYAAQAENFSHAASMLNVTQPAVSSTIRLLEESLDVQLFDRTGRNVVLTFEGQTLLSYVKRGLQAFTEAQEHLSSINRMADGIIKIGASDTIAKYFIFDVIKKFSFDYPRVRVLIQHRSSPQVLEALRKSEIDIAFVNWYGNFNMPDLTIKKIKKITHTFASCEGIFDYISKKPNLDELMSHPIIALERRSTTRQVHDQFFKDQGIIFSPHIEFGSYDLIVQAIEQGMGIGIVPTEIAGNLKIINGNFKLPDTDIYVVTRSNGELSVAAKKLLGRFNE